MIVLEKRELNFTKIPFGFTNKLDWICHFDNLNVFTDPINFISIIFVVQFWYYIWYYIVFGILFDLLSRISNRVILCGVLLCTNFVY